MASERRQPSRIPSSGVRAYSSGVICVALTWSLRSQMGGFAGSNAMRPIVQEPHRKAKPAEAGGIGARIRPVSRRAFTQWAGSRCHAGRYRGRPAVGSQIIRSRSRSARISLEARGPAIPPDSPRSSHVCGYASLVKRRVCPCFQRSRSAATCRRSCVRGRVPSST